MFVLKYTLKYTLLYIFLCVVYVGFFVSFCYLMDKKYFFFKFIVHLLLPEFLVQDNIYCFKNFFRYLLYTDKIYLFVFIIFNMLFNIYAIIFALKFTAKFVKVLQVSLVSFVFPDFSNFKKYFTLNKRKYLLLLLTIFLKKIVIWFYGVYLVNFLFFFIHSSIVLYYAFLLDFIIGRILYSFSVKYNSKHLKYLFFDKYGVELLLHFYFLIILTTLYITFT